MPDQDTAYTVPDLRFAYIFGYEGTCGNCQKRMILPVSDQRIYGLKIKENMEFCEFFLVDRYLVCPHCRYMHKFVQLWSNSTPINEVTDADHSR